MELTGLLKEDPGAADPRQDVLAVGKTDRAGRFRLTRPDLARSSLKNLHLLAAAPGHALGWKHLSPDTARQAADLRLGAEQIIRGRLFGLQGLPAAGNRQAGGEGEVSVRVCVKHAGAMQRISRGSRPNVLRRCPRLAEVRAVQSDEMNGRAAAIFAKSTERCVAAFST